MEALANKKCPWCNSTIVMVGVDRDYVFNSNVNWKNRGVWMPACVTKCSSQMFVLLDAKDEEEAWEQWNK